MEEDSIQLDSNLNEREQIYNVFALINEHTNYKIVNELSGNQALYHKYVRKFLTTRAKQIFNSDKVIIYAQVPLKYQTPNMAFSPSKYKKAVQHLFDTTTKNSFNGGNRNVSD